MDASGLIHHLRNQSNYEGQIVHIEAIPDRPARYGALDRPLHPELAHALEARGLTRWYSHQAQAINAVRSGQHVVVSTGTASGKTLCYNVPVLETLLHDRLSRALYLFPTKALAQDQVRSLTELTTHLGGVSFGVYDGDTSQSARARLRRKAAILLTNPDMLHVGILPNHTAWAPTFRHLQYVVVDEAHSYRGVFGSHVACVLRRLRRICALYGARPQFILCSATIANPQEHAHRLVGEEVTVVDQDGSPQGGRQFVLWNPPLSDRAHGRRRSVNSEAAGLFVKMVQAEMRNITFARTRRAAELIRLYARDALRRVRPELVERIASYRGGYLAQERRDIERRLFAGELLGVTATNALELGIDIGALDAAVLVGYPGSVASTWQQAGRAGRSGREALCVLIGQDNPLDQYFMRHPSELFARSHEHALIAPGNPHILSGHLPCAALESPLSHEDATLFGSEFTDVVRELEQQEVLQRRDGRWYLVGDGYPAQHVNLRSTSEVQYTLIDEESQRVLEEVDAATAFFRVHPGAIYLHRAESYLITRLDLTRRVALARRVDPDYYTQPREVGSLEIVRSTQAREAHTVEVYLGNVRVTQQVVGFRRRQQFTEALLSEEPLDLPPTAFETEALWFEVPPEIQREVARRDLDLAGGLHAVEHGCIAILPLFAMCDRDDIGGLSTVQHPDTGRAQIFVHDAYPGGVGIAHVGYDVLEALWQRTLEVIRECPCESGCPSCIQSPKCGSNNEPLDKDAAIVILESLL